MARYSHLDARTVVNEGEIYQLVSEDSDDEYCDSLPFFKDPVSNFTCPEKSDISGNPSEIAQAVQVGNITDHSDFRAENFRDVLDPNISSKEVHHSSGKSSSSENSIDQAFSIQGEFKGSSEYLVLDMVDNIVYSDFAKLMKIFKVHNYSATTADSVDDSMVTKCRILYERDYHCEIINNYNGVLCDHYPVRFIIPVAKKSSHGRSEGMEFDPKLYAEEAKKSAACRLRKRFVAPVIMFDKKFICRAGTITVRKTAAFETAVQSPSRQDENVDDSLITRKARNIVRAVMEISSWGYQAAAQFFTPSSIRNLRDIDAKILRDLKVQYICDLMIEDRKKYRHVRLSSSEKINPDIYCDCNIEQMPYPGCGFFRRYHRAYRNPEGLIFNWARADVNTVLKLTEDLSEVFPDIEWDNYKEWDVVDLTKNYMKILLFYLAKSRDGLLVHCISGWDRTPLFISMLRVTLWADGVIHQSLNYKEMAYLTLAYDWYLFGHNLSSRLKTKQEIMHFCFNFLQRYMIDDEFSLTRMFHSLPIEQRENRSIPDFRPGSRSVIGDLCSYVLNVYDEFLSDAL